MQIFKTVVNKIVVKNSILARVVSNFSWSVVSEATGKGVFFFTNVYLARTLGVSNYGLFTLAQTITYYFWLAVDLGTNMYGIREIAKNKERAAEIVNPLLTLRITAGIIVFSLYTLLSFLFDITTLQKFTFIGCGFYLLTYSFYPDWIFKGIEKFKYIAFGSFISSIIFLVGVFLFVKGNQDVIKASFIWSLSYFWGSLSLIYFLLKKMRIIYRPCFNIKIWILHIRESIFFTISGTLMVIYQYLPLILLGTFYTSYEVGIFSASYKVITMACSAGFLIPIAFYPVFSELYEKDKIKFKNNHKNFQRIMLTLGVLFGCVGTFFGYNIIKLLFGYQYIESVKVFRILIWVVPLYFLRYTYGTVLLATGFQKWHNLASLIGVVFMGILGLFFIPKLGAVGGAWSIIIAEIFMISAMSIISKKTFLKKRN